MCSVVDTFSRLFERSGRSETYINAATARSVRRRQLQQPQTGVPRRSLHNSRSVWGGGVDLHCFNFPFQDPAKVSRVLVPGFEATYSENYYGFCRVEPSFVKATLSRFDYVCPCAVVAGSASVRSFVRPSQW